jgi:Ca-activated chloride channel family protein
VKIAVTATNRFVPAGKERDLTVRLRIVAERVELTQKPPINLALVADTSGSMAGDGIDRSRAASAALLERMTPGDTLSVVAFGSRADVLVPSTVITKENVAAIRAKIETMTAQGTTDMASGLSAGLAQVQQRFNPKGINRIVLLGDGVPNDPAPLLPLARNAGQLGVSITTLGLGLEYDETLMGQLAQTSGGTFHYMDSPERVASVFDDEIRRLKQVVQKAGWLTLTPGPGVVLRGVIGLAAQPMGRSLRVALGDMSEGQTREVLVRATVGKHPTRAIVEVMDAVLTYQDALSDMVSREERAFASVTSTASEDELTAGRDKDVEHLAARMLVADLIVRAIASARGGDLKTARALVDEGTKVARDGAKTFADDDLAKKVKELEKLRSSLPSLAPPPQSPAIWRGGAAPALAPAAAVAPDKARAVRKAHSEALDAFQAQ